MSPLACSLLALAALISATDALIPNPYCSSLKLGKKEGHPEQNYVHFTLPATGGDLHIPDRCTRPGNMIIGETISVCNTPNSKPDITQALQPDYHFRPNFALVNIDCPSHIAGCDRLQVDVMQYCAWAIIPDN